MVKVLKNAPIQPTSLVSGASKFVGASNKTPITTNLVGGASIYFLAKNALYLGVSAVGYILTGAPLAALACLAGTIFCAVMTRSAYLALTTPTQERKDLRTFLRLSGAFAIAQFTMIFLVVRSKLQGLTQALSSAASKVKEKMAERKHPQFGINLKEGNVFNKNGNIQLTRDDALDDEAIELMYGNATPINNIKDFMGNEENAGVEYTKEPLFNKMLDCGVVQFHEENVGFNQSQVPVNGNNGGGLYNIGVNYNEPQPYNPPFNPNFTFVEGDYVVNNHNIYKSYYNAPVYGQNQQQYPNYGMNPSQNKYNNNNNNY